MNRLENGKIQARIADRADKRDSINPSSIVDPMRDIEGTK